MRRLLLLAVMCLPALALAQSNGQGSYRIVWDDFQNGFSANTATSKWFYFSAGPFVGDDGIVTTDAHGLKVRASGTNPTTGLPAFTNTVAPESQSGIPGGVDHVKWLVYSNHVASSGYPGFDAVPGKVLSCEGWVGGRTYGTEQHPFGTVVDNPNDDLRLASFALNSIDFETFMVFDFFITNETIYAFYERLPFGRDALGYYASFSHMIPVHKRSRLDDRHHLKISYDRAAGKVMWFVNGKKVFEVSNLGYRLNRSYLTLDHGGVEGRVEPRQLDCGMGLFTLLDAYRPSDLGLVRLSEVGPYFDPDQGEPVPEAFWDDYSEPQNRLWGQGAEMTMKRVVVSSLPANDHGDHDCGNDD